MTIAWAVFVAAAAVLGIAEASAQTIAGTRWTLYKLHGELDDLEPPISLAVGDDWSVSGTDGCNSYHGTCAIAGTTLRLDGELAVTMMACPEPLEERAAVWHRVLQSVASFSRTDAELILNDAEGKALAALREVGGSIEGLWTVAGYNNGKQAVVSVHAGSEITLRFGSNGRVTGRGGCNRYFADYVTKGDTITIGPTGSTKMFCSEPEGVMEQEELFLAALERSATYRREGDRLTLRSAGGSIQLSLTAPADDRGSRPNAKIKFDRNRINAEGLQGSDDGLRALHYEYCIPDDPEVIARVTALDPTLQIQGESPGRAGCGDGELLCLGSTHQPGWEKVLDALSALPEIREIREAGFE